MLPVVLLFGIYGGVMTPTGGCGGGRAYALLASTVIYRSMPFRQFYNVVLSSARATTSVGMLIAGALVFNYVVTIEQVPLSVQGFMAGLSSRRSATCCSSTSSCSSSDACWKARRSLLVIVPILMSRPQALGVDLVHFGVVVVNIMIELLTPPFGCCCSS